EESLELFRRAGDEAGVARADWMLAMRDLVDGHWDRPLARAEETVAAWRRTGDRFRLGDGLVWLAVVEARAGRLARARSALEEARELAAGAGGIAWWQEDLAAAARFYEEALAIERRLGDPARTADALYNQAFVVAAEGDFEGAFRLFEESLELFRRAGTRLGRPGPTG
ncbi:MAG TPA: tetratricopeptide repeat protein, partial [Actinomycetota bacterium]